MIEISKIDLKSNRIFKNIFHTLYYCVNSNVSPLLIFQSGEKENHQGNAITYVIYIARKFRWSEKKIKITPK